MVKGRLKTERILIAWALVTALWGGYFCHFIPIKNVATYSYTLLILFWVYSLKDEIPDPYIKRNMSLGGMLLTLLFILRFIKYNLVPKFTFPHRLMWYGYYIPILITPLLSLMICLSIGGRDRKRYRRLFTVLSLICALLLTIVLTNDIHGLAIKIWYVGDEEYSTMGVFYYLIIIWYVALMLSSFIIAIRKCILSAYRKYWIIPAAIEVFGGLLWLWYYMICKGSSPSVNGNSLYNIQEVYVLLYIGFWEAMISVGLIPTVSLAKDRAWISDGISGTVSREIVEIKDILERIRDAGDDAFQKGIKRISFIGIYIKRRANLELITSESGLLSSSELSLAVREALDYFDFSEISAGFEESGDSVDVPMLLISGILELLKNISCRVLSACYVKLVTEKTEDTVSLILTVEADMDLNGTPLNTDNPYPLADKELFDAIGAKIRIYEEDDTWKLRLSASCPALPGKGLSAASYRNTGYGLQEIASYLSLEKEVLAAKTGIHDSLGRCLLLTKAYLTGKKIMTREEILYEWDHIVKEMSAAPPYDKPKAIAGDTSYFISQAESMGVDIKLSGEIPDDRDIKRVLDTALTVHITNVLRHAGGSKVYVDIKEDPGSYRISFTNNGEHPRGEITEKGGLKNLRQLVCEIGGTMEIEWLTGFNMILTFPKEKV